MLFINEWRFCLRQPLVLLSLIVMPLFAYILAGGTQGGGYSLENQLQLTHVTLLMLVLPIVLGALSPIVFLRDTTANMTELINSTPITHNRRWLLRYGTMVSLLFVLFVLCFASVLVSFKVEFGFSVELIILTMFNLILLVLPSILLVTAFSLCLSTYWQSAMVMYVCIAAVGMSYLMLASLAGSPVLAGSTVINNTFYNAMSWLDPYGISALLDNINSANTYTSDELLTNRLVYLLLSVALVYVSLTKKPKIKANKKRRGSWMQLKAFHQLALKKR